MDVDLALQQLRELHDKIKDHPYWTTFKWDMFKQEVCPTYREVMELYSYLRFSKEYKDYDSPWLATMSTIYHDFSAMLGIISYNPRVFETPIEDTDTFKQYYLPMLQNFLQILHFFVEGMNTPENMVMYMPKNVHNPKSMLKYMSVYHDTWEDETGYKFWSGDYKWRAIQCIKKEDVPKFIERYRQKMDNALNDSLKECYQHYIMDLEKETQLVKNII